MVFFKLYKYIYIVHTHLHNIQKGFIIYRDFKIKCKGWVAVDLIVNYFNRVGIGDDRLIENKNDENIFYCFDDMRDVCGAYFKL